MSRSNLITQQTTTSVTPLLYRSGLLILVFVCSTNHALAASVSDFRVVNYTINQQPSAAELCLHFNSALDTANRSALAASIHLQKDEERQKILPHDLSVTPNDLCIQSLAYGRNYHLELADLSNQDEVALTQPVTLDFTVPPRKANLAFLVKNHEPADIPSSIQQPLKLEFVNIQQVRLTLYRLKDNRQFAAAWRQYQQAGLVPSESLIFAQQNAEVFWQSDLALPDLPHQLQEADIKLPEQIPTGLYFLTAAPRSSGEGIEADPKLLAGKWLLQSNLQLAELADPQGFSVFATQAGKPAAGVTLQQLDLNNNVIGEAVSNSEGDAHFNKGRDNTGNNFIIGSRANGDLAFLPLNDSGAAASPLVNAQIKLDHDFYQPASQMTVQLENYNSQHQLQIPEKSLLRLLRPDQTVAIEQNVNPTIKTTLAILPLPIPTSAASGLWHLRWLSSDGRLLTEIPVPVRAHADEPELQILAEHKQIPRDGHLNLTVQLKGKNNQFRHGILVWQNTRPHITAWQDFQFGTPAIDAKDNQLDFITDANGKAELDVNLPVASSAAPALKLAIRYDGMDQSSQITLPYQPLGANGGWLGLQQTPPDHPNQVQFNLIAVDSNQKRVASNDVYYQIFEEGRSFDWFQADGRWEYRQLPQHHRIGGGHLNLSATSDNWLRWPLGAAGNYVLELSNANGVVTAQSNFTITISEQQSFFELAAPTSLSRHGPIEVPIKLSQAATVHWILREDDRIRLSQSQNFSAGQNSLPFTPAADWGNWLTLTAVAQSSDAVNSQSETRSLNLALASDSASLQVKTTQPTNLNAGQNFALPVSVTNLVNNSATGTVSAVISFTDANGLVAAPSLIQENVALDREGKATLNFSLPDIQAHAKIDLTALQNDRLGRTTGSAPLSPTLKTATTLPANWQLGDKLSPSFSITNHHATAVSYHYNFIVPENLVAGGNLAGSFSLKPNQSKRFNLSLAAKQAGHGLLQWQITNNANKETNLISWPVSVNAPRISAPSLPSLIINPQSNLALSAANLPPVTQSKSLTYLLSPTPLLNSGSNLFRLLKSAPFTTQELADWLHQNKQWQNVIERSNLTLPQISQQQQQDYTHDLLASQLPDGSFPLWQGSNNGDLVSTAAAFGALHEIAEPSLLIKQATNAARSWLQHQLENTWYAETQRADRAAAFLTLAETETVDAAALRYFADTSRDKKLPPLALAQLSLAFWLQHDEVPAKQWLQQIDIDHLSDAAEDKPLQTLAVLSRIPLVNNAQLLQAINRLSGGSTTASNQDAALQLAFTLAKNAGAYHFELNGAARQSNQIEVLHVTNADKNLALHNLDLHSLHADPVTDAQAIDGDSEKITIKFYRPDGSLVSEAETLDKDQIYLTSISGAWPKNNSNLLIETNIGSAMQMIGDTGLSAEALQRQYPWLADMELNWQSAVQRGDKAGFIFDRNNAASSTIWHLAFLLQPKQAAEFSLPPLKIQALDQSHEAKFYFSPTRWQVK